MPGGPEAGGGDGTEQRRWPSATTPTSVRRWQTTLTLGPAEARGLSVGDVATAHEPVRDVIVRAIERDDFCALRRPRFYARGHAAGLSPSRSGSTPARVLANVHAGAARSRCGARTAARSAPSGTPYSPGRSSGPPPTSTPTLPEHIRRGAPGPPAAPAWSSPAVTARNFLEPLEQTRPRTASSVVGAVVLRRWSGDLRGPGRGTNEVASSTCDGRPGRAASGPGSSRRQPVVQRVPGTGPAVADLRRAAADCAASAGAEGHRRLLGLGARRVRAHGVLGAAEQGRRAPVPRRQGLRLTLRQRRRGAAHRQRQVDGLGRRRRPGRAAALRAGRPGLSASVDWRA